MPEQAEHQDSDVLSLVTEIHATAGKVCIAVTGAGTQALAWLFAQGGASRTVLDAQVPYSSAALFGYTGRRAEQHVSASEALLMAEKALELAETLLASEDEPDLPLAGVACTAAIATDRVRLGEDRCHVAFVASDGRRRVTSLVMNKGARDRAGEEAVTSRIILNVLAEAKGVTVRVNVPLLVGEDLKSWVPDSNE